MSGRMRFANADQVTPQLWIGGDLEVTKPTLAFAQLDEIDAAGITDVIDVRLEWDDSAWVTDQKPHIRYHWLGVDDGGQRMPDEWFDEGTAIAIEAIQSGGVVLAHCHMGINRGPSMGFAILLALGWDPIDALTRIRGRRPIANIWYADDALDWWLRKQGACAVDRAAGHDRIAQWRRDNYLDVAEVIRKIRAQEAS